MPEYNDTPQATDRISATQAPIQTNFASLSTTFNVNHVGITTATDFGKHKFVSLPEQLASPTTLVDEMALFSRVGAHSPTASQMCLRRENDGSVVEFTAGTLAAVGWTRLPSGLLLKWGIANYTVGNPQATLYTFPTAATDVAFTAVYSCNLTTVKNPAQNVHGFLQAISTTQISWYAERRLSDLAPAQNFSVYYLVIGV